MIRHKIYYSLILILLFGCSGNKKDQKQTTLSTLTNKFTSIKLDTVAIGGALPFSLIDNYEEILQESIKPLRTSEIQHYIEKFDTNKTYYPLLHLGHDSKEIDIYFLIAKGDTNGFSMSVFKNESKTDEADLWSLGGFESFSNMSDMVTLQEGLSRDNLYSFPFFSNIYTEGYYNITVTSEGKIEVEKIEVAEGDIP
ncbi:hypothetical protein GCM10009122_05480 [Fulvivirga kasyanovii]